jgi:DNA-directed RNA polymerase subunit RPC12/RpoP
MPIEFSCPHCQKPLSTTEDKAGRSAKCPGCGERVTVPQPGAQSSAPSIEEDWEVPPEEPRSSLSRQSSRSRSASVSSEDGDQERQPCPMCGELIRAAAVKCRYCGELLEDTLDEGVSPGDELTAGAIFDNAWRVFQNHAGLLIGSWVLSTFIQFVFYLGMVLLITLLTQGQQPGQDPPAAAFLIIVPGMLLFMLLSMFLNLGLLRLNLNVAQGQSAGVADLFSGGSYLLPALGAALVFMPIYILGFALCILPGIFALMALWPMAFLVVDRRLGPIAALQQAWEISRPNLATILLMGLIMFGLQMLGVITCYVGFIVTVPLIFLMFTVGYLMMSGQRVTRV